MSTIAQRSIDWTDTFKPNLPITTAPTRQLPLRGSAASLTDSRRPSRVRSSKGGRSPIGTDNTTKEAAMAQSTKKSGGNKPTVKKQGAKKSSAKTTTTRKKAASVDELTATMDVARMPAGSGGIRYAENEDSDRDFLVFGQPYMTQDAFAALGLKEGDTIEVVVRKA